MTTSPRLTPRAAKAPESPAERAKSSPKWCLRQLAVGVDLDQRRPREGKAFDHVLDEVHAAAVCRQDAGAAQASEMPKRSWKRRSGRGAHQFHSPSRRISEGHEQGADDGRVEDHADRDADRDLLHEEDRADPEGEEDDGDADRGGGDHPAGLADPDRDRLLVVVAEVVLLLDPRHDQHRVVGREAEDDREEEDQAGHLDRRRALVVEEAVEQPFLEGGTTIPRVAARVSAFISSVFSGRITEPVSRKRISRVAIATIATTSGRWSIRLCFWSMNPAVLPETRAAVAAGGGRSRIAWTVSWAAAETAGSARAKLA